ncbi:MAG: hypothetical protein JWP91_445 [Fibrobacteres bacterium]|nr:hypothetical protein [Fibrobacterota bacterium]
MGSAPFRAFNGVLHRILKPGIVLPVVLIALLPLRAGAEECAHSRFKSDLLLPFPSVLIPGFGQYFQGEWSGALYTGAALGGVLLYQSGASEIPEQGLSDDPATLFDTESWSYRKMALGSMAYQGSGFLSAYSAFRSSVPRFQDENGRYLFLTEDESLGDMAVSPARFGHLAKLTSAIPLGLLAGAMGYLVVDERSRRSDADWTFTADDLAFSGALSYNAGLSEEAVFRGWLLPMAYEYTGQRWWLANGAQALLFGAAHYGRDNRVPWPQFLLGYYFGYLTRKNGWTLSESIFVHTWWDAVIFTAQALTTRRSDGTASTFRVTAPIPL